ncbi:CbtB domain-containing protein [Gordonia sp. (in: high G+C Gram-positive bacteria)]|uniref:CbtB domain-containing protein n=1 Tax=Gordonia sp. (in: high G+C Gram-positive bacteria) TaxID=84139 RepID=UPI003C70745E
MSHSVAVPVAGAIPTIPLKELAPWVVFFGLLAMVVIFFVSTTQGAVSVPPGTGVHEWLHDGRHLLGYPCH